jgi:hypothetical protein
VEVERLDWGMGSRDWILYGLPEAMTSRSCYHTNTLLPRGTTGMKKCITTTHRGLSSFALCGHYANLSGRVSL